MQYQKPSFTLPTTNRKMTQTDYEIAVGLRTPDGKLVTRQRKLSCGHALPVWKCEVCMGFKKK